MDSEDIGKALQIILLLIVIILFGYLIASEAGDITREKNREQYPITLSTIVEEDLTETNTIQALKDHTNMNSDTEVANRLFSYTSKTTVGNEVYVVMVDKGDWLESVVIPANRTKVIKIEDNTTPKLETWNSNIPGRTEGNEDYITTYKLYIPKDSIIEEIAIDLE